MILQVNVDPLEFQLIVSLKNLPLDIFKRVKFGLRPSLETYACSKEIIELLKRCWSASVQDRPDFHIIKDCMRKTTK